MNHNEQAHHTSSPPGKGATLATLLTGLDYRLIRQGMSGVDVRVDGVTADSRCTGEGVVFVALPGTLTDGHRHVEDAALRGCAAVVVAPESDYRLPADWTGTVVEVHDTRAAYAALAENFHGRPADRVKLVGITGTNGKTTVTYLLEDVLTQLGHRVGVIGTVNYRYPRGGTKVVLPAPFTTPQAMQLQALVFEMAEAGVDLIVMEVSSHALAQQRIGNLRYDVVAFTNLSRDHLDFHHTMEEYFQAKQRLFADHLRHDGVAVVSCGQHPEGEVDWSARMADFCLTHQVKTITTGRMDSATIRLVDYLSGLKETTMRFRAGENEHSLTTPLVGHFNMDNLLTALGVLQALDRRVEETVLPLSEAPGAPGRLQRVEVDDATSYARPTVFVDYAHTPDALRQVLATLGALPHRDLYCVFGCGGDRDGGKRPEMGSFAATLADVVVVTDDNPRTEDPERIRSEIVPGVVRVGMPEYDPAWLIERKVGECGFVEIGSRAAAIEKTIRAAGPEDIVLIAGKGHENYQLGIDGKRYFDDCLEAKRALLAWNIEAIGAATRGRVVNASTVGGMFGAVSTDSRSIRPGDIFVALKGERFDGHHFLDQVAALGAGCLVVARDGAANFPESISRVEVDETLTALGDMARYRRHLMATVQDQKVMAITGSCGKTTVKEMTVAIMKRCFPAGPDFYEDAVLSTRGNLNNLIGLPLSLLPLSPHHRVAVLEMGMNAPGEIARMTKVASPDICCITNVYGVHLEGLHDLDGVARAKGELFRESGPESVLIVNRDDEKVRELVAGENRRMVSYSTSERSADLWASEVETTGEEGLAFVLHRGPEQVQIHLQTVGVHNVTNGLCAAAIATAAGASIEEIGAGLTDFRPADRRMVQLRTATGIGILNDCYNANPASMEAGLVTLVAMGAGRTMAILGDMLELGETSGAAHRQLGRQVAGLGVDFLAVVGTFRHQVVEAAQAAGMGSGNARAFAEKDEAASWVEFLVEAAEITEGDWVLIKASRGLAMETIIARLTGNT